MDLVLESPGNFSGRSWKVLEFFAKLWAGGRHNGVGVGADAEIWSVTSVCLYIYMSLVYERVLEKCFWGTGKSWKSPGNFSEQKSGNPVSRLCDLIRLLSLFQPTSKSWPSTVAHLPCHGHIDSYLIVPMSRILGDSSAAVNIRNEELEYISCENKQYIT